MYVCVCVGVRVCFEKKQKKDNSKFIFTRQREFFSLSIIKKLEKTKKTEKKKKKRTTSTH